MTLVAPFATLEGHIAASTVTMLANVVVTPELGGEPFVAEFDPCRTEHAVAFFRVRE